MPESNDAPTIDNLTKMIVDSLALYIREDSMDLPIEIFEYASNIREIVGLPAYHTPEEDDEEYYPPDEPDDFPMSLEYNDDDPRDWEVAREEVAMEREMMGGFDA